MYNRHCAQIFTKGKISLELFLSFFNPIISNQYYIWTIKKFWNYVQVHNTIMQDSCGSNKIFHCLKVSLLTFLLKTALNSMSFDEK